MPKSARKIIKVKNIILALVVAFIGLSKPSTVSAAEIESTPNNSDIKTTQVVQSDDREELIYAIEEMGMATDLLDTADLTNKSNYERMMIFANTAMQRVENLDLSPEDEGHRDWIISSYEEIKTKSYYIERVAYEVNRVETLFANNDTLINKRVVLDCLGDAVELGREYVNTTTLNSAMRLYNSRYEQWNKTLENNIEQLNYAIEEIRVAINILDREDLTVEENIERIVRFADAAAKRIENIDLLEEHQAYIDDINTKLEEIKNVLPLAIDIKNAMDNLINAFESNLELEEKEKALDALGDLVDDNRYNINTVTLNSAMEVYHKYLSILEFEKPATPGEPEDNNGVDKEETIPPVNPEEPEEPKEPELPALPGEPDDDNTVTPQDPEDTQQQEGSKPSTKPDGSSENQDDENPKTGDISMVPYIGLGLFSIAGLIMNRKNEE